MSKRFSYQDDYHVPGHDARIGAGEMLEPDATRGVLAFVAQRCGREAVGVVAKEMLRRRSERAAVLNRMIDTWNLSGSIDAALQSVLTSLDSQ